MRSIVKGDRYGMLGTRAAEPDCHLMISDRYDGVIRQILHVIQVLEAMSSQGDVFKISAFFIFGSRMVITIS